MLRRGLRSHAKLFWRYHAALAESYESCARWTKRLHREDHRPASLHAQNVRLRNARKETSRRFSTLSRTQAFSRRPVCGSVRRTRATHRCCNCCRATTSAHDERTRENFRLDGRRRVAWDCRALSAQDAQFRVREAVALTHRIRDPKSRESPADSTSRRDAGFRPAELSRFFRLVSSARSCSAIETADTNYVSAPAWINQRVRTESGSDRIEIPL